MSYVYKIQPSRSLRTIFRNNLQTFSGSSHTRVFKEYRSKQAEKEKSHCFSVAIYDFKKAFFRKISGSDFSGGPIEPNEKGGDPINCYLCTYRPLKIRVKKTRNVSEYYSLSKRTKIKLRNKILATYQASKQKIKNKVGFSFITLTMIDTINDKKAAQLLNTFLTTVKKKYLENVHFADQFGNLKLKKVNRLNYIWVAERQENGRIHFHLIISKSFNKEEKLWINKIWAKIQIDAGLKHYVNINREKKYIDGKSQYINTNQTQKVLCTKEIFSDYYHNRKTSTNTNANGVESIINSADIKNVYDSNFLAAYLSGYVSKNNQTFECRAWHCSRGVSGVYTDKLIQLKDYIKTRRENLNSYKTKKGKEYKRQIFKNEYCEIISIVNKKYFQSYYADMSILNAHILQMTNDERKKFFISENPYFESVEEIRLKAAGEDLKIDLGSGQSYKIENVSVIEKVTINKKLCKYFEINNLQSFELYSKYLAGKNRNNSYSKDMLENICRLN